MGILEQILANQATMIEILGRLGVPAEAIKGEAKDTGKEAGKDAGKDTGKGSSKGAGKSKKEDDAGKPKHTKQEMVALLSELSDKKSKTVAKEIINEVGGVDKMKDIPADKYDAVVEAAEAALNDSGEDQGEDDEL